MPERLTAAETKRVANFRAGLILESVLSGGWWPEDLEKRYGSDGLEKIADAMHTVAEELARKGGRKPS